MPIRRGINLTFNDSALRRKLWQTGTGISKAEAMKTTRTATVVNGTLKFDEPLDLPDLSRVEVTVATVPDDAVRRHSAMEELFKLSDQLRIRDGERLTRDQMHERD